MNTISTCTCGCTESHSVAHRTTADGIIVHLWSDGMVTGALGRGLQGVPMRRPRTPEKHAVAMRAGHLLLGEACIWNAAELGSVYAACERAAQIDGMPGTVRRLLRERDEAISTPKLDWTVQSADRNGKTTERTARLPRAFWPGMVVFDFCGGPGSKYGRYVLMERVHGSREDDPTYRPMGLAFRTLDAMWAHLRS